MYHPRFVLEQEEISDDIAPLYEQLATIDERIRQLNETVTDGFKYTLFALETLEETTLEQEGGAAELRRPSKTRCFSCSPSTSPGCLVVH